MRVLINGANRGIGLAMVQQFRARGEEVTALVRRSCEALDESSATVHTEIDVSEDACVERLRALLPPQSVDLLICNAGLLDREVLGQLNFDSMRRQFEINALGPLRVVEGALEALQDGGKIALITSRMGSIEDNTSGARYGYRMSKAALNMAGMSLSRDLRARGIAVAILHPGLVATRMTGWTGISPEESAQGLITRMDELTLENSGSFWHQDGTILPW